MKNKSRTKEEALIIIGIIIIILIVSLIIFIIINKKETNNNSETNNMIEKIDQMENYDYYLDENATNYYKELYNELKDILNSETLSDEEYAKIISKLFVTDLFTLDNKITSSDIGGLQFIFSGFKEDFINLYRSAM